MGSGRYGFKESEEGLIEKTLEQIHEDMWRKTD